MKALLNEQKSLKYVTDFPEPVPRRGEVKVRVHCTTLNPTDVDMAEGHYDLLLFLSGARSPVRTGLEFSGTVLEDSEHFKTGEEILGYTRVMQGPKTHQEILSIPEDFVARKPETLSFAEAACVPVAAQTCLVALRDLAKIQEGQRILIHGASGGLGVFAIQLAKHLGAEVTAVAGPSGQKFMASLGADTTLDYTQSSIFDLPEPFDLLFDLSTRLKFREAKTLLTPQGMFIPADPMKNILEFPGNLFRSQKAGYLLVDRGQRRLLEEISEMIRAGTLQIPQSREFAFSDIASAISTLKQCPSQGRIVLKM